MLRLVVICDLICVLLLSGVQKEDLDVNTLRKLQRHNVNIDDIDSEKLRQECFSSTVEDGTSITKDIQTHHTTINPILSEKENHPSLSDAEQSIKMSDLDSLIKDFINNKRMLVALTNEKLTTFYKDIKHNSDKEIFNPINLPHKVQSKTKTKYVDYDNEEINLDKIFRVWKTHRQTNKPIITTEKVINADVSSEMFYAQQAIRKNTKEEDTPENETDSLKQKLIEVDHINQILIDYISKRRSTTNKPPLVTATPTFLSDEKILKPNLNEQYLSLLKHLTEGDINKGGSTFDKSGPKFYLKPLKETRLQPNTKDFLEHKQSDYLFSNYSISKPKLETKNEKNVYSQPTLYHFDDLKKYNVFQTDPVIINSESIQNSKYDANVKNENKMKPEKITVLPPEVLKEIAANVKLIVLKDLQSQMPTTPTPLTDITTKSTAKLHDMKQTDDTKHIIENIMQLVEKLKGNYVERNIIVTQKTSKEDYQVLKQNHMVYSPPIPYMLPIKVAKSMRPFDPYDFKPQHSKTRQDTLIEKPPIIQTNSEEVRPLVIPLTKPSNAIAQTIVLTTKRSVISRSYREHSNRVSHYDRNSELNNYIRHKNERLKTYIKGKMFNDYYNPTFIKDSNNNHNNRDMAYKTDYNKFDNHRNHYDYEHSRNIENEKYRDMSEKRYERPRYSSWERNHKSNYRPASRELRPLQEMKRVSTYDDTHFKNFLKTQQKVNDMLERILATKTVSRDGGLSTEVI